MGFDNKGNLFGVGESSSIVVCELGAKASSENTVTLSGITIDFPGGTQWDGKYIGLGDQEAGGSYLTGVWPSTLSGTTLSSSSEVMSSDSCYSDYVDDVNPFFISKKKNVTNASTTQATSMVGPNLWCYDAGSVQGR